MKKVLPSVAFATSSLFAVGIGSLSADFELGGSIGQDLSLNRVYYGGFARVWLGGSGFVLAPQVKYEITSAKSGNSSFSNLQAGLLAGYNFSVTGLIPYLGVSYSNLSIFNSTIAYNYGVAWLIPAVPVLTLGIDGSYQTSLDNSNTNRMTKLGLTVGVSF